MRETQYILVLVALYVGSVHSAYWDFAKVSGNNLEFYLNGTKTHSENITTHGIGEITYDSADSRMFFFDNTYKDTFIFSFDMTTKKTEALVLRSQKYATIRSIAFDPIEELLFWNSYSNKTIYWFSLKSGVKNNVYGNLFINTSDHGTSAIAIDSCRGYIYWTCIDEFSRKLPSLIQRARFDGSEREVVVGTGLQMPERLIVDHQTQKLYWTDGTQGIERLPTKDKQFTIESADLNGKNRRVLYRETGLDQPMSIAVSEDSIYWTHLFQLNARQLPKNPSTNEKPKEIPISGGDEIVTNYKIEQQIHGVEDCERLKSLLHNNSLNDKNHSLDVATDIGLYRVHDTEVSGESQTGEMCNISVCHNYCFEGDCTVSDEGQPKCRCNAGYSGQRCEVSMCQGYCLNDGVCSLNENEPVCQCRADYEGKRCEVSVCLNRLYRHFQTMFRDFVNADITQGNLGVKSTCAATIF